MSGELHAKLRVGSGMRGVRAGGERRSPSRGLACEDSEVGWAWLRCPWVAEGPVGLAAVPVGGGGAWPGFETTRRAKLAARTASGRAAAHGHTKQPGPTKNARPATIVHSLTATLPKVI